ncbi:unnamed protein product [Parajaminaea phylloscopi]
MWTPDCLDDLLPPTVLELQRGEPRAADALPTLILIHPGGGLSNVYARLHFDPRRRVLAISQTWLAASSGPASREFSGVHEAAATYWDLLESDGWLNTERMAGTPLSLGGWSYGGVVALEMAYQIQQKHQAPRIAGICLFDAIHPMGIYDGARPPAKTPQTPMRSFSTSSDMSDVSCASDVDETEEDRRRKASWQDYRAGRTPISLGYGGGGDQVVAGGKASSADELLYSAVAWYMSICMEDAGRQLRKYDPSHLHFAHTVPVTLYKAGKASPSPRSLSGPSRIQRIKKHICPKNGWLEKDLLETTDFQSLTLPATITHDAMFLPDNIAALQHLVSAQEYLGRF